MSTPTQREEDELHDRRLLRAMQIGHPIIARGKKCFIQSISYQNAGGGIEATVYVIGSAASYSSREVTFAPRLHTIDLEKPSANPSS